MPIVEGYLRTESWLIHPCSVNIAGWLLSFSPFVEVGQCVVAPSFDGHAHDDHRVGIRIRLESASGHAVGCDWHEEVHTVRIAYEICGVDSRHWKSWAASAERTFHCVNGERSGLGYLVRSSAVEQDLLQVIFVAGNDIGAEFGDSDQRLVHRELQRGDTVAVGVVDQIVVLHAWWL